MPPKPPAAALKPPRLPRHLTALQSHLEAQRRLHETTDFITQDPVQFAHAAMAGGAPPETVELVALVSALFSYGSRPLIVKTLTALWGVLPHWRLTPQEVCATMREDPTGLLQLLYYRFQKPEDIRWLFQALDTFYAQTPPGERLPFEAAFHAHLPGGCCRDVDHVRLGLDGLAARLCHDHPPTTYGARFMLPLAETTGARKRLCMFLRWMTRPGPVDLALWRPETLTPAQLVVPLDTHVATNAKKFRLTTRQTHDWRMACEITEQLRHLAPDDPLAYDLALFGQGAADVVARRTASRRASTSAPNGSS